MTEYVPGNFMWSQGVMFAMEMMSFGGAAAGEVLGVVERLTRRERENRAWWEEWSRDGRHLETFTIITTEAAPALSDIHDRQPVVVDPDDFTGWLDPATPLDTLQEIIGPPHEGPYEIRPVSEMVNRVANDTPDILEPPVRNTLF
jgi:hypothetical protein